MVFHKMVAAIILTYFVNIATCHIESPSSLSDEDFSDNLIEDKRRHNKKYKGLSIEVSDRKTMPDINKLSEGDKSGNVSEAVKSSTTDNIYPPLSRQYRRIYNPDEVASIEDYPFLAALLVNGQLWCGGVIIDNDKVLTAAHCLQLQYNNRFFREYVKMLTVRVGSTNATAGGEILGVTEIFFHPNYKPQTLDFNFAVVKLHRMLTFGRKDVPINSVPYSTNQLIPADSEITFLGWGSVLGITGKGGEVLLQKVKLPVYDLFDCQEIYGRELVTRNNFCAGYISIRKNVCNHDAGGPAILGNALIGTLSFSSKRCDTPDMPAVFSTIGPVTTWMENLGDKQGQLKSMAIK